MQKKLYNHVPRVNIQIIRLVLWCSILIYHKIHGVQSRVDYA